MIEQKLLTAIQAAWSEETSAGDNEWTTDNPAGGHCDVTALYVREAVGGDLQVAQVFRGGELSEHHFWNVLPDGTELDLTKSQFDGSETFGEATLMDAAFFAAAGPMNASLVNRLDLFRCGVDQLLEDRS